MGISVKIGYFFAVCCIALPLVGYAQTSVLIRAEMEALNMSLVNQPCATGKGMLISNKAMNIFLSEKVASYLSDEGDLSLYKNYVTANAADGKLAISHNFRQPVDSDDRVRSFVIVGARANMANTYTGRYSGRYLNNQLGLTLQKTWMSTPITSYDTNCSQKQAMDRQRALILRELEFTMDRDAAEFEQNLTHVAVADVPGQSIATTRQKLRESFYTTLRENYLQKFFEAQSNALISSANYKLVTDSWTTTGVYIPIIPQKFEVNAKIDVSSFTARYCYPLGIFINHTQFWVGPKLGRLFLTFGAQCLINNSVQAGLITAPNQAGEYSGDYKNFLTPSFSGKLAYLPMDSHVGLSIRLEKNLGIYHSLNGIVGIPIVLIDKKGVPAVNFECQLRLADLTNSQQNFALPRNRTSVGITIGIPFSKIVY